MNNSHSDSTIKRPKLMVTSLAALGIVFGDIGTSPLYAFRECFAGHAAVPINPDNLIGAASLIVWSLILVVSVKYIFIILRLDNRGEGGILALAALIRTAISDEGKVASGKILMLGLAGGALIYADGMLTPAISVLSAVEGLSVSAPVFAHWAVPIAVVILTGLFMIQRFGTGIVGKFFGPIVLLWFAVLALLGILAIVKSPEVLFAMSPHKGIMFLVHEWRHAFPLLAAVFLAVTGGEALYADLGHFGVRPIRVSWFALVMPALVLNYLGQAELVQADPFAIHSPFFLLAPPMFRLPLTILATCAAINASQALISGAFSLTTQAIQLGCLPRFRVLYTSDHSVGQVYVPAINRILAISCILLVITFKTSANLAGAYGIAISLTMVITSILFYSAARNVWKWSLQRSAFVTGIFLLVDGAFLVANGSKVFHGGGWFPLVIGASIVGVMLVWIWGRARLFEKLLRQSLPVEDLLKSLQKGTIHRVQGTAIYMSGKQIRVPNALLHNLKHNQVLHERVLLLHVMTLEQPQADEGDRVEITDVGEGMSRVILKFGFTEVPDVPQALESEFALRQIPWDGQKTTYFLGNETYEIGRAARWINRLRLPIFAMMAKNASPATAYFQLPPGRVVELGSHVIL